MSSLLVAADVLLSGPYFWIVLGVVFAGIVLFSTLVVAVKQYKRCPSNRVLVVFGRTGRGQAPSKCIHGGWHFVVPLAQDYAWLKLEPMQIEIPLRGALSMENIRVNVPSVFTVAIGTTPELMQNAAIRLLGLSGAEVTKQAEDMIFGQLRQVIASMQIEDINRNRDKFLENVQQSLEPELKKIGLVLINVNITDITDESGYIEAIGQKAASQAIQKARGDVAEQEKLGETRVAEAERDRVVQVANAHKTREIGTREAMREQAVRIAELDKEQQVGEKTAAFLREAQVKDAEREMRIKLADADAKAVEGENLAKATIAASQAALQVKKAEARGQFEILAKKGEGLQRIIDACGGAQQAFQMLMLEHFDHLVEASAQAISNIKFDKVVVWEGGGNANGTSATANWLHNMARTLPPMMQVMKDIGGVEIPETLASLAGAKKPEPAAEHLDHKPGAQKSGE